MIVDAIDLVINKRVHISDAVQGRRYACEHCGVEMEPVKRQGHNHFYRCTNQLHQRSVCAQRGSNAQKIYNADEINPDEFIAGLFSFKKGTGVKTPGGSVHGPGVVPHPGMVDPHHKEIVPCKTLKQLWDAKVAEMPYDMPIGKGKLADLFVKQKDFWRFLESADAMHNRVLEVKPLWYYSLQKVIVFAANWKKKVDGEYVSRQKLFLLRFSDDELFSRECKKIFVGKICEKGTYHLKRLYNATLVAGCWRVCKEEEYRAIGLNPYDICIGVQIAECVSHKQIFGIPETKNKEVN